MFGFGFDFNTHKENNNDFEMWLKMMLLLALKMDNLAEISGSGSFVCIEFSDSVTDF